MTVALEELGDCIPALGSVEAAVELEELTSILERFLRTLPEKECCIFLRRYWYVDSVGEIAKRYEMPEGSVKSCLYRVRQKLLACLKKEEVWL